MKAFIVARYTLKDILQSRMLYVSISLGFVITLITFISMEFTYGVPERVALDVGLGLMTLTCVGLSVFYGATLISKEMDTRTIYMMLSRPVSRLVFLVGKIIGLSSFITINTIILSSFSILTYLFIKRGEFDDLIIWVIIFTLLEAMIVLLITLILSLITNNSLTVVLSICVYVLGHAASEVSTLEYVQTRGLLETFINIFTFIIPNFSKLNIKSFVLYNGSLEATFLMSNLFYGLLYSLGLFVILSVMFKRKELN